MMHYFVCLFRLQSAELLLKIAMTDPDDVVREVALTSYQNHKHGVNLKPYEIKPGM